MNYTISFPKNYIKPRIPGLKTWTAALRSGQFENGSRFHRSDDKFSVLGVLLMTQGRMAEKEHDDPMFSGGKIHSYHDTVYGPSDRLYETNPVFEVVGKVGAFPDGVTVIDESGKLGGCILAVDSHGYTFDQQANILESIFS